MVVAGAPGMWLRLERLSNVPSTFQQERAPEQPCSLPLEGSAVQVAALKGPANVLSPDAAHGIPTQR